MGKPPYMKFRLVALLGAFLFSTANAVEVTSLYTAQVPLDQDQRDPRAEAYRTALAQVVLRVSGGDLLNDVDLYEALFPDPSTWVIRFRPGPEDTLFVTFDGEALEEMLASAGQTVWSSDRPLTLVWLAVDWGQGDREIVGANNSERRGDEGRSVNRDRLLRQRMLDFADRRGLPIVFPLMDSEDRASVEFSDIWGGFDDRVLAASERYDVNSVLIGRVRATSAAQDRWSYHFAGEQRSWAGEPEFAIMEIADLLAAEFAIDGDAPLRSVDLNVSGITTIEHYGRVQQVLAGISVVDSFSISEVAGDRIRFTVNAHGGAERLARALRFEGLLEEDRIDMGQNDLRPNNMGITGHDDAPVSLDFYFSL